MFCFQCQEIAKNTGFIPWVLDAGQCNDSYSLAVIALKLMYRAPGL